jgi:N-carbamoyl-L-amino-acid hydrolase
MKSKRAADIAQSSGTIITFKNQLLGATPALTDKSIQEKIVRATKSLNLTYKQMQSGAGHDSQDMALIAPIGMIFVPSVAVSHSKSLAKQLIWRMERTYSKP